MHEELGDRKPSQFLRHLQSLANNMPEDILKTVWLDRFSVNIQTVVAAQPSAAVEVLAEVADRVHEIAPPSLHIAASSSDWEYEHLSFCDAMAKETELRKQIKNLMSRDSQSRSKTRKTQRGHSSVQSQSNYKKFPLCWYSKFGKKAISRSSMISNRETKWAIGDGG
ncbi:hypothetical protein EVAR_4153_1 [Eumeta japonica]|uniref:Uncharacterized protein n=1 Tax=Eumeta variegata TaxID=151549 RepID=A0A4C1TJB1_EUMVA|nr:hypothetical protein EVAR_4153_1 [Eumeta japonica]